MAVLDHGLAVDEDVHDPTGSLRIPTAPFRTTLIVAARMVVCQHGPSLLFVAERGHAVALLTALPATGRAAGPFGEARQSGRAQRGGLLRARGEIEA